MLESKSEFNLPWKSDHFEEMNLGDLACKLETNQFLSLIKNIWNVSKHDAIVEFKLPHPRHDMFFADPSYVKALMPFSFEQLDKRYSKTGLADRLMVNFEIIESLIELDPIIQEALDKNEISENEIWQLAKQANNIIQSFSVKLKVNKSTWQHANNHTNLTDEMQKQLLEQIANHNSRGNFEAANTIKNFLASERSK